MEQLPRGATPPWALTDQPLGVPVVSRRSVAVLDKGKSHCLRTASRIVRLLLVLRNTTGTLNLTILAGRNTNQRISGHWNLSNSPSLKGFKELAARNS